MPQTPPTPRAEPSLVRAVLVEDETMFRQLIRSTLDRVENLEIIGEFGLGRETLDFCVRARPDILVLDLRLPDMDGLEVVQEVRGAAPDIKILVMTAHPSEQLPLQLVSLGVHGYIDKGEPIEYLLNAIETIRYGGMFFATHVRAPARLEALTKPTMLSAPLTEREKQVARLVTAGRMSKEIAEELGLSIRTVEKHRENLMQKVGVRDVVRLTRWCLENGLGE